MRTMTTMIAGAGMALLLVGCEESMTDEPEELAEDLEEDIEEEEGLAAPAGKAAQEQAEAEAEPAEAEPAEVGPAAAFEGIESAIAVLHPTEGNELEGKVRFASTEEGVKVTAHVEGLEPGTKHGFHVHQLGDCSAPDGTSAGGHYNPADMAHALPPDDPRHAGDMGNLEANDEGMAHLEETFGNMSLIGPDAPILGRGVIVHAEPDDGGQPTGNAGPRIACGVIGVAE